MDNQHIIPRDGTTPLRFTGIELGHSDSFEQGKQRWSELTVYRTDTGKYVIHGEGVTDVPGEDNRSWAAVCDNADGVLAALYRENNQGMRYLTRMAQDVLDQAAANDEQIDQVYGVTI